jgi:RNA polymerase sigma-70 factor (ECF subfamily)
LLLPGVKRHLVERAAAGDGRAFEALVRGSADRLFAIASRIVRDHHRAEDALQQTLVAIWDELPRLRDPDRFDAWTYRLIVRASITLAKRERRGGPVVQLLPDDAVAGASVPGDTMPVDRVLQLTFNRPIDSATVNASIRTSWN